MNRTIEIKTPNRWKRSTGCVQGPLRGVAEHGYAMLHAPPPCWG
ncbi:MAG: hypothetical protein V8R75_13505 [Oscillospiraceae bacterium]